MRELLRWAATQGIVWLSALSHSSRGDDLAPAQADAFNRQRGGVRAALLMDSPGTMGRSDAG